jgi:hypothetical protein
MAVETTMRQVGRPHDVGDTDAAKTFGAKQRARGFDDAFAALGGFFPAYSHRASQQCVARRPLTNYMMNDINTQH